MYQNKVLRNVSEFINNLSNKEQGKVRLALDALLYGHFQSVHTKMLRFPIRELIVLNYRILFFIESDEIYFVSAFTKKTAKTPLQEIENALRIYHYLKNIWK
ncbi:MAG: type II toxin-antitoxin system RelE/ParE family toxin [bacterium]